MTTVRFSGRVLFLTDDPELVRLQLAGRDLAWSPDTGLRHDISTDEITPAWACYHADERLGEFAYVGLACRDETPIGEGAVRRGGFQVSVSGRRRGKGSSREAAPYAERAAGIRLVVAESFERIYRENCQNLGIYTSTDFSLLELLARGEPVPLERFTAAEGPVGRSVVAAGGLLGLSQARLARQAGSAPPEARVRPMTLAEKIIARHWVTDPGSPTTGVPSVRPGDEGFVRADLRFSHEYVTPMAAALWRELGPGASIRDPRSVLLFRDHLTLLGQAMPEGRKADGLLDLALELKRRQEAFAEEHGLRLYGELPRGPNGLAPPGAEAICHAEVLEHHALPGQIVVGSDSHTPHSGAIGCVAFGVGTTALCAAWLTQDARIRVPESVLVRVRGRLPANVVAKDLILHLLRQPFVREGKAIGAIVEYAGEAVEQLSLDERATLTNMAAEVGAFTGIVRPDGVVARFLEAERGLARPAAAALIDGLASDPDAVHAAVLELDAALLRPMVALPGDPGHGRFLDELGPAVPVNIAYAGSCTAGKRDDMDMYARVFRAAAARGARVAPGVRCYVQFGSQDVKRYAERRGYVELFRAVGAEVLEPSCGACINAGPGVSYDRETVTVSAINRNFPGRSGPGRVYLASPYTVAASAIAGEIVAWDGGE
ncbi:MAG TPA: aconitase family protein [Gemmatimonadales bacterium]|nr:aconitase family protein [Gemmatimonadales bacterium]